VVKKVDRLKRPRKPEKVACKLGLKEMPVSKAKSEKAADYAVYYYCSRD